MDVRPHRVRGPGDAFDEPFCRHGGAALGDARRPVTTHEELSRFDFPVLLLTGDRSSNHSRGSIRAGRDDGLRHGIDFFGNAGPVFLALGWRHMASNEAV